VLGLGTQLDTARFCSYIARRLQVPATQVNALILGEHGDSMVPIWSSAAVAGLPMAQWPGFSPTVQKEVFEDTKTSGAQCIKLKGGSAFADGLSIREVVHALATDSRRILPVSTLQQGAYGIRDVCLSVPTVVGCGGARQQIELELTPKEKMAVQNSAKVLRDTIDTVEARIGKAGSVKSAPANQENGVVSKNGHVVPRSAWQVRK
jgi:L-lactate dehydrogenase